MEIEDDLTKPVAIAIEEDDAPVVEAGDGKKPAAETPPSPQEAVAELKQQIERANAERDRAAAERAEAERRAAEQAKRADTAQAEVRSSEAQIIANALETTERDLKLAKQSYAAAMAAGDYEGAAEAQIALSEGAAKRLQLSNAKAAIEQRLEKTTEGRVAEQPTHSDPVEQWASQLSARSAEWVRSHRDAVTDPAKSRKLSAAHNAAVDLEGLAPDTDAYFAYIEQRLGYRRAEERTEPPAAVPQQRSRPMPAAPSSSGTSNGAPRRSDNVITLSPVERETARALGMTEKEYAINKAALIKEGKLSA